MPKIKFTVSIYHPAVERILKAREAYWGNRTGAAGMLKWADILTLINEVQRKKRYNTVQDHIHERKKKLQQRRNRKKKKWK
jgi:hypothetical protein